jgi:hypothetical protein
MLMVLLLLWVAPAGATKLTFDDTYTIDLPQGWIINQAEPGYIVLVSPDQKAVFLITSGLSIPKHREKIAGMVKRYDNLRIGAPDRFVTLMRVRDRRVAVTILGDHPDRVRVYRSIEPVAGDKMRDQWRRD